MLYRLSYRTSCSQFVIGVAKIGFLPGIPKNLGRKFIKKLNFRVGDRNSANAAAARTPYIPYSLKNFIRISFSCSQVKLPSESSCCATCRLLVSQLLK